MPYYEALQKEDHGFDFTVVLINLETRQDAMEFGKQNNYALRTLVDEQKEAMIKYGVRAIPDAVLIDSEGIIRGRYIGGKWKLTIREALARERVRQYLATKKQT